MVDPFRLGSDIVQTTIALATPALLWVFLFLFAWEETPRAEATGFGRRTFWLLLPGALLGTLVNVPFFAWSGDVLSVNVGGGLIPVLLSFLLVRRTSTDPNLLTTLVLVALVAASGASLMLVFLLPEGGSLYLAVAAVTVATAGALAAFSTRTGDLAARAVARRAAVLVAFSLAALFGTFVTTQTIPGLGIVSEFPSYLIAPVALGALAGATVPRLLGETTRTGLVFAYASVTLGVLIGADLLREPGLYAPGSSGIYAVGGAGTSDLVYLSGLLALAAAFGTSWLLDRGAMREVAPAPRDEDLAPGPLLRRSLLDAVEGRTPRSVAEADRAVTVEFAQARRLLGLEESHAPSEDLEGIPAPAWVLADRMNLAALARNAPTDPIDGTRAWLTARWLVRFARMVGARRFGRRAARGAAFAVDLMVITAPAVFVWYWLATTMPGSGESLLTSVALNTAVFAYIGFGFLYFVLTERLLGQTAGKRALGLAVTGPDLQPPATIPAMLRSLPKVIPLVFLGYFGLIMVVVAERASGVIVSAGGIVSADATLVTAAVFLSLGVLVPAAIAALVIGATPEHQRVGDLLAGTWVVRRPVTPLGPAARTAAPSSA